MKTLFELINGLKKPTSLTQYVLYKAIKNKYFNHYSIDYYGTSKRVHNLRKMGCEFISESVYRVNRYGQPEHVMTYHLTNKDFAIELYKSKTE